MDSKGERIRTLVHRWLKYNVSPFKSLNSDGFTIDSHPLTETPLVGNLVRRYLENPKSIEALFGPSMDDAGFKAILQKKKESLQNRQLLQQVISEQYQELERLGEKLSAEAEASIQSLSSGNTFTVTTGHQLHLACGPLFFALKILTAVAAARHFKSLEPDIEVVPVFWLASEDHDMDEINHINLHGEKISWNSEHKGASGRASCAGLMDFLKGLQEKLGDNPFSKELFDDLSACYRSHYDLSTATRALVNRWFGRFGVVVLDANDARLKRLFLPVLRKELLQPSTSKLVESTIERFPSGIEPQVKPREINLFYLTATERHRIIRIEEDWKVLETDVSFDREELEAELERHPDRFSPNVLLRPLYQETVLPNLAYVAGPAELAYWLELKSVFIDNQLDFPLLLLRDFFLHIDVSTNRRMEKTGIRQSMLFGSLDDWMKKAIERNIIDEDPFEKAGSLLDQAYETIKPLVSSTDASLVNSIMAEKQKSTNGLENLREKWIRAEKRKHEDLRSQCIRIKDSVFPNGVFQERMTSLLEIMSKTGPEILDLWLKNCKPYNRQLTVLTVTQV